MKQPALNILLRRWRKREGLTQAQAAASLLAKLPTYRAWEYGQNEPNAMIRQMLLQKIAAKQPKPRRGKTAQ